MLLWHILGCLALSPNNVYAHIVKFCIYALAGVWLSGLSASLGNERSLVLYPLGTHAWVAGRVPRWGRARGNSSMYLSHINGSLSLSPSLSLSLKTNNIF